MVYVNVNMFIFQLTNQRGPFFDVTPLCMTSTGLRKPFMWLTRESFNMARKHVYSTNVARAAKCEERCRPVAVRLVEGN